MSWTVEQLLKHPKRSTLLGAGPQQEEQKPVREVPAPTEGSAMFTFVCPGPPVGKPRMTQRDKWQKRPAVLRYRDYCDRLRAAAGKVPADVYAVWVVADLALPESWSKKKKAEHHGWIMRSKPDGDNILKAVCDALFEEDSGIADERIQKFWCYEGEETTTVHVLYFCGSQ